MVYICVVEVLSSNISSDNGYPDWGFFLGPSWQILIRPHYFQFTDCQSSYHLTLDVLALELSTPWILG
jgi:hypothetical protein